MKKIILRGIAASPGVAVGHVRIISGEIGDNRLFKKLESVKDGDVLVTNMTRPAFTPILRKVSAIITDKGGMLCHAAVVAREFGKPCIVDTKMATIILKSGQRVEVDAIAGLVYEAR